MNKYEMMKRIEALEARIKEIEKPQHFSVPDGYEVPANAYKEDVAYLSLSEVIKGLIEITGLRYVRPIPSSFDNAKD